MDPKIAARFNDSILQDAMQRYAIQPQNITLLDGFESLIYEFSRPDGSFILRLGHSSRRTPDLIRGEVDWINYLSDGGVSVARAIRSQADNLVECIPDGHGQEFLCTAFVKARGGEIKREQANPCLFEAYGRLMGRIHALSKAYQPSNPAWRRYTWDDPYNNYGDMLPSNERLARGKYQQVVEHLATLPCESEGYGMIHQDAHPGNFFVDDDYTITLFDFDDCVYGHFIYDIAMVAFYTAVNEPDPSAFMAGFMPVFLKGYSQENRLDPKWLKEIPWFLKLREIELFGEILFMQGEDTDSPWSARYLKGRRDKIEKDIPFIDFDWVSLSAFL